MERGGIMQVVFFDGVCVLCNHFVQFLLRWDTKQTLYFSPLQGQTILKTAAASFANENTMVFCKEDKVYIRSDAAIQSIASLGGVWKGVKVLLLIPKCIRDAIYQYIAAHRYGWFGKNKSCFAPTEKQKQYFLE